MSFEIQSTFMCRPDVYVCTTGISACEKVLIRSQLPKHVILEDVLSAKVSYLATYKATMTDKYIQALSWNMKIVDVRWLYDVDGAVRRYEMQPFEGASFSTSGLLGDSVVNYHLLLGGIFTENLMISTDFLIAASDDDGKAEFSKRYGIPIVNPDDAFKGVYEIYKRDSYFEAVAMAEGLVFDEKVFFLDARLPRVLFNQLRRMIVSNGGTRVSQIDKDVDYILAFAYEGFEKYGHKVYHYQYVFDCIESKAELFAGAYRMYPSKKKPVLSNIVCCVSTGCRNGSNAAEIANKLKALGAIVRDRPDASCTHMIVDGKDEAHGSRRRSYKVVLSEWVNQCLGLMRHVREEKYCVGMPRSSMRALSRDLMRGPTPECKMLFQFTGLSLFLKNKAMERLDELGVGFKDTDRYDGCTHLIMGVVSTSEKLLSCVSNGKWILKPSVIDDFDGSHDFDFAKHEWKDDECVAEKDRKVVLSICKWREKVKATGKPAFYRWIVKLLCEDQKREGYARMIENGGGRITDAEDYTHCFVSRTYDGIAPVENRHSTDYIFSYLFR
ncbi:hypothetical protein HK407_02g04220 [Ordospora pajunii]|uniref:uncharacterized protein n=1 Tax=Ordospora pajunii TaxID=3039483 RepID=UPI0029526319|nr:uncharacterized protein HK407_02g04220 [Ordospora pajunii]KAH9411975.1 hypothetical protein HK407_02g04220 [Ordospora pajunii]